MSKCDFNKVAKQADWNHTSDLLFSASFLIPVLNKSFIFAVLRFKGKVSSFIERLIILGRWKAPSLTNSVNVLSIPESSAAPKFFKIFSTDATFTC